MPNLSWELQTFPAGHRGLLHSLVPKIYPGGQAGWLLCAFDGLGGYNRHYSIIGSTTVL